MNQVVLGCAECELGAATAAPRALTKLPREVIQTAAGAFTAAGARQAVVMFRGCEPQLHVAYTTLPMPGGGVGLLDKTDSGWRLVRYISGVTNCQPISLHDGRAGLACLNWDTDGHHRLDLLDFAATPQSTRLLDLPALQPLAVCDAPQLAELMRLILEKVQIEDLNGDGVDDIQLRARLELTSRETIAAVRARSDFALACGCSRAFAQPKNRLKQGCQCSFITIAPDEQQKVELTFVSSGSGLNATAETSVTVAELSRYGL